jgi:hypothetical protein
MVTESLFGMLTAAGTALLPYFLILSPDQAGNIGLTGEVEDILLLAIFTAVPLAMSQTELGIAAGSHYYETEGWIAMLGALALEGGTLGIYFATRPQYPSIRTSHDPAEIFLLVSTVGVVPIADMVLINVFKKPRGSSYFSGLVRRSASGAWATSIPLPSPYVAETTRGISAGVQLPLLSGTF